MTTSLRILQIDDDADDLFLFARAVRTAGLPVQLHSAHGGKDALAQLAQIAPHVIVLDIHMPMMSGFEFLEILRKDAERRSIPVVIFSSSTHYIDIQRARELGADDYFVKPSGLNELTAFVKRLYDKYAGLTAGSGREWTNGVPLRINISAARRPGENQ